MNKLIWIVLAIVVLVGGMWWMGVGPFAGTAAPAMVEETTAPTGEEAAMEKTEVVLENFAFTPPSLTVAAGTTVTFTNKDLTSHTATADDGTSFDTGLIGQNESATVTFDTPGTYTYHCTPHPNMKGTIVVE
jgi:plastocyanin